MTCQNPFGYRNGLKMNIKNIVFCHLCIVFFYCSEKFPGCKSFYFDREQSAESNNIKLASFKVTFCTEKVIYCTKLLCHMF